MQNGANEDAARYPVPRDSAGELIQPDGYHYPDYPSSYYGGAAELPEGTDWVRLGKLLWQRKWWIVIATVLGTSAGYMAARFVNPMYEASTTIWIEETDSRSGPIRSPNPFAGAGFADVFRSRAVLQPVVEKRRLYLRLIKPLEAPPGLFADFSVGTAFVRGSYSLTVAAGRWTLGSDEGQTLQVGRIGEPIGEPAGFVWRPPVSYLREVEEMRFQAATPVRAALRIRSALQIRYNQNSQIISARLTWRDPHEAAEILNDLADQFLGTATDLKAQKLREEVEMLQEQTGYTQQRLEAAEIALESHRVRTITMPTEPVMSALPLGGAAPGSGAGVDPVFNAYFQRKLNLETLQSDLLQLDRVATSIRTGGTPNTMALRLIPSAQNSLELGAVIDQLQTLQVERRTLLTTLTEQHPTVLLITQQIRGLQTATIPSILGDIRNQVQSQITILQEQIGTQETELRRIPTRTIEGARRQREVTMAEALHNMLLVRLKEAELAEATSGPGIQILDPALPPNSPISNSGPRIVIMFSLASLGVGVAGVLLHDRLDKRIRYPDQVTTGLGLPILGVVPRLGKGGERSSQAAVVIESFRGLRTQIAHADGKASGVHLVTSPSPQEGKSMVSANLAISYATAGLRTVLVDGDTRRGRAQGMFGLPRSPGLTDYLLGNASLAQVSQATEIEHLTLIARGRSRGFNADLLDGKEIDELFAKLGESYEVVIVDAPPLAAGADVLMLGKRVDKVVLVLRAGSTHTDLAKAKLVGLGNVHLPIIGAVLNAMPKSAPYYDRYVHYYYADAEVSS